MQQQNINVYDYMRAIGRLSERLYREKLFSSNLPQEERNEGALQLEQEINNHLVMLTSLVVHSIGVPGALDGRAQQVILQVCEDELGEERFPDSDVFHVNDILSEADIERVKFTYRQAKQDNRPALERIVQELIRLGARPKLEEKQVDIQLFASMLEAQLAEDELIQSGRSTLDFSQTSPGVDS